MKQQLIDQLTKLINDLPDSALLSNEKTIDLYSLFEELIALKAEVKQESRQLKNVLDDFRNVFNTLKLNNETLAEELNRQRQEQAAQVQQQTKNTVRAMVIDLLDINDKLNLSLQHLNNYQPGRLARILKKEQGYVNSIKKGQTIIASRVEQIFKKYQITAIKTIGFTFDAATMEAIAVESNPAIENNIVTQEFRKGYQWQGEILRTAEVQVNKKNKEEE